LCQETRLLRQEAGLLYREGQGRLLRQGQGLLCPGQILL